MTRISLKEHLESIDNELASLILTISKTAVGIEERLPYMRDIAKTKNARAHLYLAISSILMR